QSARLDVSVKMSDIKSYVEDAPVTNEQTFTTGAVVNASGVYLLGTLVKDRVEEKRTLGWKSGNAGSQDWQVLQVWEEAGGIGGAVHQSPSPSQPVGMRVSSTVAPMPDARAPSGRAAPARGNEYGKPQQ